MSRSAFMRHKRIVISMVADPEPQKPAFDTHREHTMAKSNASRPEVANFLQPQRRVVRVALEKHKCCVGMSAYRSRKPLVSDPELSACLMFQRARTRPDARSSRAAAANSFSFPDLASRSILASKRAASNVSNQRLKSSSSCSDSFSTALSMSATLFMIGKIPDRSPPVTLVHDQQDASHG